MHLLSEEWKEQASGIPETGARFRDPALVFRPEGQELQGVQQVPEGIGAVPELVLAPEAGGDRGEGQLIDVRSFRGDEIRRAGQEVCPPAGKKSDRVQASTS